MKEFILAPYVTVGFQKNKLFIGFGSIQFVEAEASRIQKYLSVLAYFKEKHSLDAALSAFSTWPDAAEYVTQLQTRGFLIEAAVYNRAERMSRQKLFFNMTGLDPQKAQENLAGKKVAIIGCGGIGNQVSVHLATAGVDHLVLCDADTIELSNLSRQILFKEEDVGQSKAHVLARELKARSADLQVEIFERHILNEEDLDVFRDCDFLVVSADAGDVVNTVNRFCVRQGISYLNVGYVNDIAVWGPLYVPRVSGCYSCQDIIATERGDSEIRALLRKINLGYQAPSVGPINMVSAGLASVDILKFLAGAIDKVHSLNKRLGVWTHSLKVEEQNCARNPDCRVCGEEQITSRELVYAT